MYSFPDAELAEDAAQEVVGDVLAGDGAQSGHGGAQVAADKVERRAAVPWLTARPRRVTP
jgi:hypothetical protein